MKSSSIRFVVILAVLCISGITVIQWYWVRRAFDLKEAEFQRTVSSALFNVASQIFDINKTPSPAVNPVKQLSTNYFVVQVNGEVDASLLEFLLRSEFEKRNIAADFEYGVYDCSSEKMKYGDYIPFGPTADKVTSKKLPTWSNYAYYFGVQFPNREAHLINQMGIWSFSSFVLLLVILFFAYSLFVILKQKRLSEIQKDFINNMTHEFKTPISTIAVSAQVLKDPDIVNHPERLLSYSTIIEKENMRLKHQVERVLQMAKFDKDNIGLKKEKVDVHEIINDAIGNIRISLQERDGAIHCDPAAVNTVISADRLHLTNVLYNLIDNAIKYCSSTPEIQIATASGGRHLRIEVRDNGLGIAHENHKKVFQKFYRVPTGNVHDVIGFGLGLHYVKSVVDAHKGTITLQSDLGKGSSFTITLPV
ncbi:MAG: HAMP domain-containing histidine kinase [Bacteroidota bacterium]|nr:HAMP domain-containing histidine kinase [Bacteroidota bacterium]